MLTNKRLLGAATLALQLGVGTGSSACEPPVTAKKQDAEADEPEDDAASPELDAGQEPATRADAGPAGDPAMDSGEEPEPEDAGQEDAWVGPPPPPEAKRALCSDAYDSVKLQHTELIRGSWQYNPGGPYVTLPERGYPCRAFLYDDDVRPAMNDAAWTDAQSGEFLGFSETSTVPEANYSVAQFRYFRSLVFVPEGAGLESLTVTALGIDDAIFLEIFNSEHPEGISPLDAGPSEEEVGACFGNNEASWDFKEYILEGEVNALFLVHADMNPSTSTLTEVRIEANGQPIQIVSCKED